MADAVVTGADSVRHTGGGSGRGVLGSSGVAVTTTAQIAADSALARTYAGLSAAGGDALRAYRDMAYAQWNAALAAGGSSSLILGHSVVNGSSATSSTSFGFPALVKAGVLAVDPAATVTVDGNPGYTSTQLVAKYAAASQLGSYQALTVFMGLLNDYSTGIAPATSQTNIQALVAKMKAIQPNGYPSPAFLVVIEWLRTDAITPAYPWPQYVAAAKAVAAADSTVTVLDLSTRMGSTSSDAQGIFANDHVHPVDKGHAMIARYVLGEILAGTPRAIAAPENVSITAGVMAPTAQTNWSTVTGGLTGALGGYDRETDGTQNAQITYSFSARAGTYKVNLFNRQGSNRGQYSVYIDGVLQSAALDAYAGSPADVLQTLSGTAIVVGDGVHTITLKMAAKNASSTGYVGSISGIFLNRTGA